MIKNLNLKQPLKIFLHKVFLLIIDLLPSQLSCNFNNLRQKIMKRNIFFFTIIKKNYLKLRIKKKKFFFQQN